MEDGAALVPLTFVIESLRSAHRLAVTAQATLQISRLSVELPVFVEKRGPDTFIRFPRASDTRAANPVMRLMVSIGPSGEPQVIVEPIR